MNKNIKNVLILILFCSFIIALSSISYATNYRWKYLFTQSDNGQVFLDTKTITREFVYISVWIKEYYPDDESAFNRAYELDNLYNTEDYTYYSFKNFKSTLTNLLIKNNKQMALKELINYNEDGTVINRINYSNNLAWDTVVPGSTGETLYNKIRKYTK